MARKHLKIFKESMVYFQHKNLRMQLYLLVSGILRPELQNPGLEEVYLKMFRQFFDAPSVIEVNYENHSPGDYLVPKRLAVEFLIGKSQRMKGLEVC